MIVYFIRLNLTLFGCPPIGLFFLEYLKIISSHELFIHVQTDTVQTDVFILVLLIIKY